MATISTGKGHYHGIPCIFHYDAQGIVSIKGDGRNRHEKVRNSKLIEKKREELNVVIDTQWSRCNGEVGLTPATRRMWQQAQEANRPVDDARREHLKRFGYTKQLDFFLRAA